MEEYYRLVTASFFNFYKARPFSGKIKIALDKSDFDLAAKKSYPKKSWELKIAPDGSFADGQDVGGGQISLWCNGRGSTGSRYVVTLPEGETWKFVLHRDDGSAIDLTTLRAGGIVPQNSNTILTLIGNSAVRFDAAQTLSAAQKAQARSNIGVGTGGGAGVTAHGDLTGLEADDHPQYALNSTVQAQIIASAQSQQAALAAGLNGKAGVNVEYITDNGTAFTILAAHKGKIIILTNALPITATVPNNLAAGFNCAIRQGGAGEITVAAGSGVTLANADAQFKTAKLKATVTLDTMNGTAFDLTGYTA